ncbi:MAG: hypothetical protein KC468_32110 [Myxococcales bacterium]|nr:hypothetical protein [Myxococcales bacterium]
MLTTRRGRRGLAGRARALACLLTALFALLTTLGLSATASAAPASRLRVKLALDDPSQLPTHACVLSLGKGPDAHSLDSLRTLGLLRASTQPGREHFVHVNVPTSEDERTGIHWALLEAQLGPELTASVVALASNGGSQNRDACTSTDELPDCRPEFHLRGIVTEDFFSPEQGEREHAFLRCATNSAEDPKRLRESPRRYDGRVLVLSVTNGSRLPEDRIRVEELQLNGSVLELRLSHSPKHDALILRVNGGFYVDGTDARLMGGQDIALRLEPRCSWTTVKLPPIVPPDEHPDDPDAPEYEVTLTCEGCRRQEDARPGDERGRDDGLDRPLGPRCVRGQLADQRVSVLLPYARTGEKRLTFRVRRDSCQNDQSRPWCIAKSEGDAGAGAGEVDVSDRYATELEASWGASLPPDELTARVHKFGFTWRVKDCLYLPSGICPKAQLAESGVACRNLSERVARPDDQRPHGVVTSESVTEAREAEALCYYECPASEKVPYVEFSAKGVELVFSEQSRNKKQWTQRLGRISGRVGGYVPRQERTIRVQLDPWIKEKDKQKKKKRDAKLHSYVKDRQQLNQCDEPEARRRWCRDELWPYDHLQVNNDFIRRVEFSSQSKGRESLDLSTQKPWPKTPELHIRAPNAICNDEIIYRYYGDHDYRPGTAVLTNGRIALEHPEKLARRVYFTVALYPAGLHHVVTPGDARRSSGVMYAGELHVGLSYRPFKSARGWRFDALVGGSQSLTPAYPINGGTGASRSEPETRLYTRLLLTGTVVTPWLSRPRKEVFSRKPLVALGFGLDGAWGFPTRRQDAALLGAYDFGFGAHVDFLRLRLYERYIELIGRARMLCLEDDRRFSTDWKGDTLLELNEHSRCTFGLLGGFSFSW